MQEIPHQLFRRGNRVTIASQSSSVWRGCVALTCVFPPSVQVRSTDAVNGCRDEVDTALLKLYAELDHDSLLDLLASDNSCVLTDSVPWLEKYHKCVCCYDYSSGLK